MPESSSALDSSIWSMAGPISTRLNSSEQSTLLFDSSLWMLLTVMSPIEFKFAIIILATIITARRTKAIPIRLTTIGAYIDFETRVAIPPMRTAKKVKQPIPT